MKHNQFNITDFHAPVILSMPVNWLIVAIYHMSCFISYIMLYIIYHDIIIILSSLFSQNKCKFQFTLHGSLHSSVHILILADRILIHYSIAYIITQRMLIHYTVITVDIILLI